MGVEPTYQAWEACILPMNYARILQGPGTGPESVCLLLYHIILKMQVKMRP